MNRNRLAQCPRCGDVPLVRHTVATGGLAHQCPKCHGTQMLLSVLRSRCGDALAPRLWAETGANPRPGIACPLCRRSSFALVADGVELDLCRSCQSLWFDADELERFPLRGAPTQREAIVDTTKYQPRMYPAEPDTTDPDTTDEGSLFDDIVEIISDILTDLDSDSDSGSDSGSD